MPPLKLNDDDGYLDVEIASGDAQVSTHRLDLFEANNTYATMSDQHQDAIALGNAWCDWLEGKGFPRLSHAKAFELAAHVMSLVGDVKKKAGNIWASAGSPGSTASTPSSSPPSTS